MDEKTRTKQYRELVLVAVPAKEYKYKDTHKDLAGGAIFAASGDPCQYLASPSKKLIAICEQDGVPYQKLTPGDCPLELKHEPGKWAKVTHEGGQFIIESNDTLRPLEG